MARPKYSSRSVYNNLMQMAVAYGVNENPLFMAAAHQYQVQQTIIDKIRRELSSEKSFCVEKEYVKNRENTYVHPLIKELPKHSEAANKTAQTMLSIITQLGKEPPAGSKLEAFNKAFG